METLPYDAHIRTSFSDGHDPARDCVRTAEAAGLSSIALTDHVGPETSTENVMQWFATARLLDSSENIKVLAGVHGEILDTEGTITINRRAANEAALVLAALGFNTRGVAVDPPASPKRYADNVIAAIDRAAANPLVNVIATPLNLGRFDAVLTPGQFSSARLRRLARTLNRSNVAFEISNQAHWWYPQLSVPEFTEEFIRVLRIFSEEGAKFIVGSNARTAAAVGNLQYCRRLMKQAGIELSQLVNLVQMAEVRDRIRREDA